MTRRATVTSSSASLTSPGSMACSLGDGSAERPPHHAADETRWTQDASIVLVGIRGTGKTSLAVLAAGCIGYRVVDADQNFYAVTGLPRAVYASHHGFEEYRRCELALMRAVLEQNPTRCLIVCGPGSAEGTGQELLREFKKHHPVIYVMRDAAEVDAYLHTHDTAKIANLCDIITPSYRALSNYEFYNLSEPVDPQLQASPQLQSHPSLMLKHLEHDLIYLLRNIRNRDSHPIRLEARHSLSFLPPESKPYTYALTIPFESLAGVAPLLRIKDPVADAVEIVFDLDLLLREGHATLTHAVATNITRQYCALRRNARLPVIFHVKRPPPADDDDAAGSTHPEVWSLYFALVAHAIRLAPEYLTLDLTCSPAQLAQKFPVGPVVPKIIGHFFDHNPGPRAWDQPSRLELLRAAENLGCDIVRICQPATSRADNAAVQRFLFRAESEGLTRIPIIAFNTGRMGRSSCFTNSILTPVTHCLVQASPPVLPGTHRDLESIERIVDDHSQQALLDARHAGYVSPVSPDMLTVQDAQRALYASFVLDRLVFGIFGRSVLGAMSPAMHNAAFRRCGMPHHYRTFESASLRELDAIVRDPTFGGASISAPFKRDIIAVLDHISPEAQAIGAINTLIPLRERSLASLLDRNRAGPVVALFGDNTDWIGLHVSIRRHLSPINAVRSRTTALILGAGGMAHAAVYAAIRLGVRTIFIYNRTRAHAEQAADRFNGRTFSLHNIDLARSAAAAATAATGNNASPKSGTATPVNQKTDPVAVHAIPSMDEPWPAGIDPPSIIVSCIDRTSKDGQAAPRITVPDAWLTSPTGGVVVDLSYNPIDTPLIQQARAHRHRGWIPVHGLQVLPEQATAQFELFTGRKAPRHIMLASVEEYLAKT